MRGVAVVFGRSTIDWWANPTITPIVAHGDSVLLSISGRANFRLALSEPIKDIRYLVRAQKFLYFIDWFHHGLLGTRYESHAYTVGRAIIPRLPIAGVYNCRSGQPIGWPRPPDWLASPTPE